MEWITPVFWQEYTAEVPGNFYLQYFSHKTPKYEPEAFILSSRIVLLAVNNNNNNKHQQNVPSVKGSWAVGVNDENYIPFYKRQVSHTLYPMSHFRLSRSK